MHAALYTATTIGTSATVAASLDALTAGHSGSLVPIVAAICTVVGQWIAYKKFKLLVDAKKDKKQDNGSIQE